jgi:hypothetical protein
MLVGRKMVAELMEMMEEAVMHVVVEMERHAKEDDTTSER